LSASKRPAEPAEMEGRVLKGLCASSGFCKGRIFIEVIKARKAHQKQSPDAEERALIAAIAAALSGLSELMAEADEEAGAMLAFQMAMLEDDALTSPARDAIREGEAADQAFKRALDDEIAGYEAADDAYFRARASDLVDLRDRVLDHLLGSASKALPKGCLLLADDMTPSRFLSTDWAGGGILLRKGSPSSHVAMLARARGVPMVVGFDGALSAGTEVLVDAEAGHVVAAPSAMQRQRFLSRMEAAQQRDSAAAAYLYKPAMTADGEPITIQINIASPDELDGLDPALCDGIGLVRTELLFEGRALPDEDTQYAVYARIIGWANGRPVTIRTLDAGGDKPIPGVTAEGESNPFLGLRGVRLTLQRADLFRVQLAALCRAAAHGPLQIMLPMVSIPEELVQTRALLADVVADLARRDIAHQLPPLGMMVEVPAAAIAPEIFDAEFYSIGSNDLTQYVLAAGRDIASVAPLARTDHPAVLRLVGEVARYGAKTGRKVSLCGDAGGDPAMIPHLLRAGLRTLSMAPRLVASAKALIASLSANPI
jgi:phosphoenolpyruvate-protein phosphotransferase (PTS system enzyme I)